jgi:hypothetical protein
VSHVSIDLSPVQRTMEHVGQQLADIVEREVGAVNVAIGLSHADIKLARDELRQLSEEFQTFVTEAQRTARVQRSETKVGNLQDQLDREFGHYDVVRRTSVGMLQAFDVGNVSQSSVRNITEELMIQTPRYWLAPALVGVAAWSMDNREIAEKSVNEAFSRDAGKTSLFFALILRRQQRTEVSVRWLKHYLGSLDPAALGREFAVVLEAASHNAFGREGQLLVTERMASWVGRLRQSNDVVEEQVDLWRGEVSTLGMAVADGSYPTLAKICPDWGTLKGTLEAASSLPQTLDKYVTVRDSETVVPTRIEDLLDDILDTLVTEYDEEELPLRREVRLHEAIIEETGDMDRAQALADVYTRALENTTDVVSLQTTAAITPELVGVSAQTQRISVGVGREDFRIALGRHCLDYRQKHPSEVTLKLDGQHSNYAQKFNFPGWTGRSGTPEEVCVSQITQLWNTTFDTMVKELEFDTKWYLKPGLIVAAVALVAFIVSPGVGVVALAAGAGLVWYLGSQEQAKAKAAQQAINSNRQAAIDRSVAMYRDVMAELVDAQLLFEELDEVEKDVLGMLDTWPTVGSHEGRAA